MVVVVMVVVPVVVVVVVVVGGGQGLGLHPASSYHMSSYMESGPF